MGPSEKTQHAIRRSTRLPLEVPVVVTSLNPSVEFSARCHTTLVNAHGCGLVVSKPITQGVPVRLEIVSAKRYTTARVAEVVPLGGDPETWLVGLELDIPGNFWGIEYAPSDWKIEESAGPSATTKQPAETPAATASRSRRWRLTDISAGACYLETASPFDVGTPILLSIRSGDAEFLLDGTVRVSHAEAGIGVEFTAQDGDSLRVKVEQLIAHLTSNREVPKIFVGRKEKKGAVLPAPPNPARNESDNDESRDSLLDLIRDGELLTAEQFLADLRAQRLGNRRDPRIELALPVLLSGSDASGRPLDQRAITVNISRRGALLQGIHGVLKPGDSVALARGAKQEQFRVAWVGEQESAAAGQIGVAAVDPNSTFWDEVLAATAQSELESASVRGSERHTSAGSGH